MKLPSDPRAWLPLLGYAIAALVVIGLIWLGINRLILLPRENATNKARAVVAQEAAIATGEAAGAALEITREVHTEYRRIDEITRSNEHAIKAAAGADARAPDVARALVRGLCQHRTYLDEPGCAALLGDAEGVGLARGDDGSPAAR